LKLVTKSIHWESCLFDLGEWNLQPMWHQSIGSFNTYFQWRAWVSFENLLASNSKNCERYLKSKNM